MKISDNFYLKEFTRSATAKRIGIDNTPDEKVISNIKTLVNKLLQPIRDRIGTTVTINSGFRCETLNSILGGSKNSQHIDGNAGDIDSNVIDLKELYKIIIEEFEFDKIIFEFGEWIHISYIEGKNRNIKLIAEKVDGQTVYKEYNEEF